MTKEHEVDLSGVFEPKSIAVVGASAREGSVGNDLFRNLLFSRFQGVVYPINPKRDFILGVKAYKDLAAVPGDVDLAVVIVPAKAVLDVVDQAKQKNVKGMVCISAGFKETGKEGLKRQQELTEKVKKAGIKLIGPNCLGIVNTDPKVSMNATFARKMPAEGSLAFVSQSGALCTSVLDYAEERRMGFSKFISFGNKADVSEIDLLVYLGRDPQTKVIAMYLEDITDGWRFIEAARTIARKTGKPMLCLKSGRSPEGAKAVSSHTGSLAGSDSIYDALLMQAGVMRVDSIAELFDYAAAFITQAIPNGNRVAIITNAGGPGIMATDAAVRHGLKLAELSDQTRSRLKERLPSAAALNNPVDVIGDAMSDRYEWAVHHVMADKDVDMGVILLTPQSMTDIDRIAQVIPKAVKGIKKPVVCSFMGARDVASGVEILRDHNYPNYPFPEDAVHTLAVMAQHAEMQRIPRQAAPEFTNIKKAKATTKIKQALGGEAERYLTQAECREIFKCYGLPVLESEMATSAEAAATITERMDRPVAMKIMSADVVHKFDSGGVLLNVTGGEAAREGYEKIVKNVRKAVQNPKIDGVLIEQMAGEGVEVILGSNRDARFGPLLMFGLGGTFVELFKDVSFRLAPIDLSSAQTMVRSIHSYKMLTGFRGTPACDVGAVEEALMRLSHLVADHPQIAELDINPLIVHPKGKGCSVADARIMLRQA